MQPDTTGNEREKIGKGNPPKHTQFKPGNSGRPKGSRNKLGEAFLNALHDDFKDHGIEAIVKVREEKPDAYMKVIASILPKEIDIGDNAVSAMKESRDASVAAFLRAAADDAESALSRPRGNA